MPESAIETAARGAGLHYEVRSAGPETIVFAHGLLFSSEMFEKVVEHLAPDYGCVAFDFPGHGKTPLAGDAFDLKAVTDQVEGLLRALGPARPPLSASRSAGSWGCGSHSSPAFPSRASSWSGLQRRRSRRKTVANTAGSPDWSGGGAACS